MAIDRPAFLPSHGFRSVPEGTFSLPYGDDYREDFNHFLPPKFDFSFARVPRHSHATIISSAYAAMIACWRMINRPPAPCFNRSSDNMIIAHIETTGK